MDQGYTGGPESILARIPIHEVSPNRSPSIGVRHTSWERLGNAAGGYEVCPSGVGGELQPILISRSSSNRRMACLLKRNISSFIQHNLWLQIGLVNSLLLS